ncbi:MAG: ester cyclase [Bacteroidota bacterium]|nr:ester cyclase [Bacteroidota bacterium]
MKKVILLFCKRQVLVLLLPVLGFVSCYNSQNDAAKQNAVDFVASNIKMYTHVWDEIINHRKLDMFNDSNFTKDVVMHVNPDKVGVDSARAYYANYLTGFSDVTFTIEDVFGMGNKLVKHWNFKGTHTGVFFGIPPTGKKVNIKRRNGGAYEKRKDCGRTRLF